MLDITREHAPCAHRVTDINEQGGEARVYELDQDLILKMHRPLHVRPRTSFKREVLILNRLADKLDQYPVLRVLDCGYRDDHIEYTLMPRLQGVAEDQITLLGGARRDMLYDLVRAVHQSS